MTRNVDFRYSGELARRRAGYRYSGLKHLARGWEVFAETFNPADKSASLTLSNGNLTLTTNQNVGANSFVNARGVHSRSTGRWYLEATSTQAGGNQDGVGMGFGPPPGGALGLGPPGVGSTGTNSTAYYSFNPIFVSGAQVATGADWRANGNTVGIAVDLDLRKFWVTNLAGAWIGAGNPTNNVGGWALNPATGPVFPAATLNTIDAGEQMRANFGASAFAFVPPAGFNAWNG